MGDDRRKRGSSKSHLRLHASKRAPRSWTWAEALFALERDSGTYRHAQSWSVSSVHYPLPKYLIVLILTSFSLHEANKGWSNCLVNTNEVNNELETKQLVWTLTLCQNQTISVIQV